MNKWELPVSLEIGGTGFPIRSDFRDILTILQAFNDPELDDMAKMETMGEIMYPDWKDIEDKATALKLAIEFIDCGNEPDDKERQKPKPKLMDWEQDAGIIIPAINKVAGREIRADKYMHWWTFMGLYMGIGESVFADVINIRSKKAKGKKLDKSEQEYYRENKKMIDFARKEKQERSDSDKAILRKYFGDTV